jgi:hypothetical protein
MHGKYVFDMLEGFIVSLKSHSPDHLNFIADLDKIGKWEHVVGSIVIMICIRRFTAATHAGFIQFGFNGKLFETLGEELVEMLVMTEFVQVGE